MDEVEGVSGLDSGDGKSKGLEGSEIVLSCVELLLKKALATFSAGVWLTQFRYTAPQRMNVEVRIRPRATVQ